MRRIERSTAFQRDFHKARAKSRSCDLDERFVKFEFGSFFVGNAGPAAVTSERICRRSTRGSAERGLLPGVTAGARRRRCCRTRRTEWVLSGIQWSRVMLPPKGETTICFAHVAYRLHERFALDTGIASFAVRDVEAWTSASATPTCW